MRKEKLGTRREYRSMIGSLLYLTVMRSDIQFVVYLCARFQSSPCTSHHQAIKWIMRYLHFIPEFGLWFLASSSLSLCGYSDTNYAGCRIEWKSTSGSYQFYWIFSCVLVLSQAIQRCPIHHRSWICRCRCLLLPTALDDSYLERLWLRVYVTPKISYFGIVHEKH
jgi:hypothetical protein